MVMAVEKAATSKEVKNCSNSSYNSRSSRGRSCSKVEVVIVVEIMVEAGGFDVVRWWY